MRKWALRKMSEASEKCINRFRKVGQEKKTESNLTRSFFISLKGVILRRVELCIQIWCGSIS